MSGGTVDNKKKKNRRNQSVSPRLFCFCFVCFSVVAQVRIRVLMEVIGSWMRRRLSASIADVTSGTLCNFTSQMTSVLSLSLFSSSLPEMASYSSGSRIQLVIKRYQIKYQKKNARVATYLFSLVKYIGRRGGGGGRKKKPDRRYNLSLNSAHPPAVPYI